MKKSLIALAALAAVTAASAQSTATISGRLSLAVGETTTGGVGGGMQIARHTGNIAFKDTEDLGGGLKANFEVQTAIGAYAETKLNVPNAAVGATTLGDRGLYVNLTGDFGTAQAGRANAAVRALFGAIGDVSKSNVVTGLSAGAGSKVDAGARVIYGDAYSNYVSYTTPEFSGFKAAVAFVPVDGDTASTKDTKSYTLQYSNGPLAAAYNLTDSRATAAAVAANTFATSAFTAGAASTTAATYSAATAAVEAYKMTTILASYDLGVAKFGVTLQRIALDAGTNPGNAYAITANVPLTAMSSIGAGIGKRSATASTNDAFGDDVKQTFVAYNYLLSKRTNVSAVYNKINRNAIAAGTNNDLKEMHVIIDHSF